MHVEDASDHLVQSLSALPKPGTAAHQQNSRRHGHECDLWLPFVIENYWRSHNPSMPTINDASHECLAAFYDAAWDLCRSGVLRPGKFAPKGQSMSHQLGDGYSVTGFGWDWLENAAAHLLQHPSRLSDNLNSLGSNFGEGFQQRQAEAVRCYRTGNFLAACVMAGAASESILLAAAIAKRGDEADVLATYSSQSGRAKVMRQLLGEGNLADQFRQTSQILHHWRDEAGHGKATAISEPQAHHALNQLLRLAQLTQKHWEKLTG